MATKDISDAQVLLAYVEYRQKLDLEPPKRFYGMTAPTEETEWPYTILQRMTGQPFKVCYRAMERAENRRLIDCGVSLRTGFLTAEGKAYLRVAITESGAEITPEMEKALS